MFDITPYLNPEDPFVRGEEPGRIQDNYLFKHAVALMLRPRSILEIGVRAGYSAAAFLAAVPEASYHGVDADVNAHGGVPGYTSNWALPMLARHFPQAVVRISLLDTQKQTPGGGGYDLVHVDGDHSFEGCLHDLGLAARLGRGWVLIDDTDHVPGVGRAVRAFLAERSLPHLFFPSFRGDCLIQLPDP